MNPLITAFLQKFAINSCNTNINANFTSNVNVNCDINLDLTLDFLIAASLSICITIYPIGKWIVRRFNNLFIFIFLHAVVGCIVVFAVHTRIELVTSTVTV